MSPLDTVHTDELLGRTLPSGCRELQLRVGQSPETRSCRGQAEGSFLACEALSALDLMQLVYAVLTDEQIQQFKHDRTLSFLHSTDRRVEFDAHLRRSRAGLEADFAAVL